MSICPDVRIHVCQMCPIGRLRFTVGAEITKRHLVHGELIIRHAQVAGFRFSEWPPQRTEEYIRESASSNRAISSRVHGST